MNKITLVKKYKGYTLEKIFDNDVDGGYYWEIYKNGEYITNALSLNSAKELINENFDYRYMV